MKTLVILLSISIFLLSSCKKEEESYNQVDIWTKVELNPNEPLSKVMVKNDDILIFSTNHYYLSKDLKTWNKFSIPKRHPEFHYSNAPFPVVFKDKIYIDGKDGLYFLDANSNWELVVSKYTRAIAADNNYLYLFSIYGSYRTSDGVNFEALENLNEIIKHVPRQQDLIITFAKGNNDKVVLAGYWTTGMAHIFTSYNNGLSWEREHTFMINDFYGNQQVLSNHAGASFYARGYLQFNKLGGNFFGLTKFNTDYYFVGLTNKNYEDENLRNKGIITINDFKKSYYFNERINKIEVFKNNLVAITNNGYIYYKVLE